MPDYYGESFDPFSQQTNFGQTDFLTLYKCLAVMLCKKIAKNNRDFVKMANMLAVKEAVVVKPSKRSSSTTRNPYNSNANIRSGSRDSKDKNLNKHSSGREKDEDDDFELSCTLEHKSKLINRNVKNLQNKNIFANKYSAFVED